MKRLGVCAIVALAAGLLVACDESRPVAATATPTEPGVVADFQALPDIPVPAGTSLDVDKSIILGGGDQWTGRVVLDVPLKASDAVALYDEQMPAFGWQPVMVVQADVSVLAYVRGARAATLQIEGRTMGGSRIALTVAPRQAEQPVGQ